MPKSKNNLKGFDLKKQEQKIVIIFILSLLLYLIFVLVGDIKKIQAVILNFRWSIIPFLLILTLSNYLIRSFRFFYYLRSINIHITLLQATQIFLAGLSMTITPGKSGEVVKAYLLRKIVRNKFSEIVPVLITERLTDGVAMIFLGLGGILLLKNSIIFFILSSLFVVVFILLIRSHKYILKMIRFLEKRFPHIKIFEFFEIFLTNAKKLVSAKNLLVGVGLAFVAWSFEGMSLFLVFREFSQINIAQGLLTAFFIFSFSSIAGFFVLIPGGIGVAEGSITYFLDTFLPLNLSQSIFITILFRFLTLWFGVLLGLLFLIKTLRSRF